MELPLRLNFPDDEEDIVKKYFKPAKVKVQTGDYSAAIKLLDNGLKAKPKSIGFRIMKAYTLYLFSQDYKNDEIDEINEEMSLSPENAAKLGEKINGIIKEKLDFYEKSIIILNDVLSQKVDNKKDIQKLLISIEDMCKVTRTEMNKINKSLHQVKETKIKGQEINFVCPYCSKQFLSKGDQSGEGKVTCQHCNKDFKYILGSARSMKGSTTRIVTYGPPPFVLRLKTNSGEREIRIQSYDMLDVHSGDIILLTYKKVGIFSKTWSEKPSTIQNFTTLLHAVL